jgi:hypothetical protein
MGDHDHSYKLLFAHPRMVRELLETFVGGEWLAQVDFDTLERVSDAYISDDLRARADDIVWRVRCGSRHVYLLIEFQSRVDSFMAVRVLAYVALLYQDIIRAQEIAVDEGLPAVLPVVLHNGSTRWYAAEDVRSLVQPAPPGLEKYGVNLRYLSIDERSYDDEVLAPHDNLVALLFRLEQCRERGRVELLVSQLLAKLKEPGQESLFRAFGVWVERVVLKRLPGGTTISNLWEKQTMLSERFDEWEAEFLMEGRRQGRREGREEGRKDGAVTLLTLQLRKRFGELPDCVRARVSEASADQLERWGERLLEASTLDDVFIEEQIEHS